MGSLIVVIRCLASVAIGVSGMAIAAKITNSQHLLTWGGSTQMAIPTMVGMFASGIAIMLLTFCCFARRD